ncbi:MAG: hypothetical protein QF371_10125, partial [Flavobacteriales bacterium]|nr:hypothetical protein [Flavobacteriales bacterium]
LRKKQEAQKQQTSNYVPPPSANPSKQTRKSSSLLERYKEDPDAVKKELTRKELRDLKKELRQQRKNEKRQGKSSQNVIDNLFNSLGGKKEEKKKSAEESSSGPDAMKGLIPNPKSGPAGSGMTAPPGSGGRPRSKPQILAKDNSREVEAAQQEIKRLRKSYLFKKVKDIDVKCRQLISWNKQVFAATNNGLYLIEGETSRNLTPGTYVNHIASSKNGKSLLIATHTGVFKLDEVEQEWEFKAMNDSISFVAYNVLEDLEGGVWAGTDNGAYRYASDETRFYRLPEIMNERVLVAEVYDKVHFLLPSGLFHYIIEKDTVLPAVLPEIPSSNRLDYLLGNDGLVWVKSNYAWHVLNG